MKKGMTGIGTENREERCQWRKLSCAIKANKRDYWGRGGRHTHPSVSVWMDEPDHWPISFSNGSGGMSNTRVLLKKLCGSSRIPLLIKGIFLIV